MTPGFVSRNIREEGKLLQDVKSNCALEKKQD